MKLSTTGNAERNLLYIPKNIKKLEEKKYSLGRELLKDGIPRGTTYFIAAERIKNESKVLEVGCSYGYFGKQLKNLKQVNIVGIDIDRKALAEAKKTGAYDTLLEMNLESFQSLYELKNRYYESFDTILCLDVLEHIRNINELFLTLISLLKPKGELIVSIPNIGHLDIIYNLLIGRFNYSLLGILDNTHLRFFTEDSFRDWIQIISEDNELNLQVELIGQTFSDRIELSGELDDNLQEYVIKKLISMSKKVNNKNLFVVQNLFSVRRYNG
ncbi:Methyltransferase type 12 [Desulfurobacterium thermolithotrophum DSM 11699]|uniref:Methyltransferase type 12 n=1 Tax=Desulfurobacterium thermolithotrophum (strain DSM 11699 / BSA) TaxID=868864 RepID=F0S145_DESTD|nr:class I SAM-dependent methyltransferase [Desulfurobacterium thermolithotrophum]ADY73923.1 Methyltransferase type 12 [Desulfurobacterium thermolithotrophum DSM 11699]